MCGRFTATFEFSDIRVRWNLDRDLPKYTPRFNVAPETSPNIPVIIRQKGVNECRLMHWGLIPHWAADPSIGNRMINARAETLTELPFFKLLVHRRRCIIPADGLYEWRKEGRRKAPSGRQLSLLKARLRSLDYAVRSIQHRLRNCNADLLRGLIWRKIDRGSVSSLLQASSKIDSRRLRGGPLSLL